MGKAELLEIFNNKDTLTIFSVQELVFGRHNERTEPMVNCKRITIVWSKEKAIGYRRAIDNLLYKNLSETRTNNDDNCAGYLINDYNHVCVKNKQTTTGD